MWAMLTVSLYVTRGSYKTWKSLNVLEFENKNFKALNVLEFVKKYLNVLELFLLKLIVYAYFLKLFDIQKRTFCWIDWIGQVAIWTIQRHILLISNAFSSVFSAWICWYME
jgi:hypothetical protein